MPLYEGIGLINEKHPVVLEIGQVLTKAGFAGETSPRCIVPSVVRSKENPKGRQLTDYKDSADLYQLFVDFLQYLYCKHLLVTPKDRKVVVVESLFSKTEWRETLARVLFLHYEVLHVLWLPSPLAAVSVTGWDTGLVVDLGSEDATVVPVFKGVTLLKAIQSFELGGKTFDKALKASLIENCLNPPGDLDTLLTDEKLEDIRVRACFVSNRPLKAKPFYFPIDGDNFLQFNGVAREEASEVWFQNDNLDGESIPLMILESLSKCPIDTRKPLAKSLLIAGGTAMIPGFKKRLLRELNELSQQRLSKEPDLKMIEPPEFRVFDLPAKENYAAWLGGAIYGATDAMSLRGLSKEAFLKSGSIPDWSNFLNPSLPSSGSNSVTSSPSKCL